MQEYEIQEVVQKKRVLLKKTCDWCGAAMYINGKRTEKELHSSIVDDEWFDCEYTENCGEGTHLISSGWRIEDLCHDCVPRLEKLLIDAGIRLMGIHV